MYAAVLAATLAAFISAVASTTAAVDMPPLAPPSPPPSSLPSLPPPSLLHVLVLVASACGCCGEVPSHVKCCCWVAATLSSGVGLRPPPTARAFARDVPVSKPAGRKYVVAVVVSPRVVSRQRTSVGDVVVPGVGLRSPPTARAFTWAVPASKPAGRKYCSRYCCVRVASSRADNTQQS